MTRVTLGFKAFDPHELLCHLTAVRAGLYRRAGIDVELVDLTFTPDIDMPADWLQVSCGAALAAALRGAPQKVVFVATDKPMFWLYGRGDIDDAAQLAGDTVATYPDAAPPAHFARILLQQAGLDAVHDVRLLPARDDAARLGLLRSGTAAGALLSSALPPARLEQMGFKVLAFVGDVLRVPTTGLAVHAERLQQDAPLIATVARILRQSLSSFRTEPAQGKAVLSDCFDVPSALVDATFDRYLECFTHDGTVPAGVLQNVIDELRRPLAVSQPFPAADIYDFSMLED